jgi:hypothetical protein
MANVLLPGWAYFPRIFSQERLTQPRAQKSNLINLDRGDQIGRILFYWALDLCGAFFENYKTCM